MKTTFRIVAYLLAVSFFASAQQIKSPSEFLGYSLGSKFSFHHRILEYVQYVNAASPTQTKIIQYGYSNEGRPLEVIVVAKPEWMAQLEAIRTSNLKSIGLLDGAASAQVPAIAWLSYNVHGNEAVSSEAVMKVLYELLNPANKTTQKILESTIVILDPCINPDGRDRYAQWYNRYMGVNPDLNGASVEHHEPWPGGRFNHYLFDLNRDWAWQSQVETQQRMALYHQWMPHLHADFHEMGANSTYYFPPSARPYHEDLTTYQRDFQNLLGDFNKKYFDENGWLYYSKEDYDLLYPSYGDTYPSYNGAIGMTFEQGGSGRAGVAFLREDGDTLTLSERIEHHYSTSIGTLEAIASKPKETVEAFKAYFNEAAKNGAGKYKSFVIKTEGNQPKAQELATMLQNMKIKVEVATAEKAKTGFSYQSRKNESFTIEKNDLVLSTFQPKGKLVKILFEPETALEDSNTYDITTWALPYAFGMKAFAVSEKIDNVADYLKPSMQNEVPSQTPYAYLVKHQSFEEIKFVAALQNQNVKVRVHSTPFTLANQTYEAGTLLITKKGNEVVKDFDKKVVETANSLGIKLATTSTGMVQKGTDLGSGDVYALIKPKVAFVAGEGVSPTAVGEVWHYFEKQLNYPATLVDQAYFGKINLWDFNVLVLADGSYGKSINDEEIKRWVSDGGKLILMEGATSAFVGKNGFKLKEKTEAEEKPDKTKKYGNRVRESISEMIPGAIFNTTIDTSHPLGFGMKNGYAALVKDASTYELLEEGWNVGYISENAYVTGFAGKDIKPKMTNVLIAGVQSIGSGSVIYFNDDPLFRSFWFNGKMLFGNAVFLVK